MYSSRDKKSDPFYKPPTSVQKTSAEIINEARHSLRTLTTKRPFTPREDQRKLFGPLSSRTPDNRPPSSFSLHTLNFDSPDSRPVSGTRLSPLPHKPKLPVSPTTVHDIAPIPQPPAHPVQSRRLAATRPHLIRARSLGNLWNGSLISQGEAKDFSSDSVHSTTGSSEREIPSLSHYNHMPQLEHNDSVMPEVPWRSLEPPTTTKKSWDCGNITKYLNSNETEKTLLTDKTVEVTANETETNGETNYWDENISPILRALEAAGDTNIEELCSLCIAIHKSLEDGNMLGKKCTRRSDILKTLYKLVDIGSDKLGLTLAKLILALKVSGKNLLNISKLIFKISRSENNDLLFQSYNMMGVLLDVLQNEDVQINSESFLYCLGTIKFLSGNKILLNELLGKEAVEVLVNLMKKIIHMNTIPEYTASDMSHLLVQITATLRNLADLSQSRPKFLGTNALVELCVLLNNYMHDKDICTNVSRILSKLSLYHDCCMALANCSGCYSVFLSVLNKHPKKQDLVVRIVFMLGNLMAKSDTAREQFYNLEGSIDTLLHLLHIYCGLDVTAQKCHSAEKDNTREPKVPNEVEDILIKLVRLLANWSIHPAVGKDLSTNQNCVAHLMEILECKLPDKCEELVISTTATISNLSYYQNDSSVIAQSRLDICKLLLKLMLSNNMERILEATRVFGNLSHYQDVRDFIFKENVYKFIVTLLDARHQDVCFSACGVLINLATDSSKRTLLKEEQVIEKLIECLQDFGCWDWQLAALVCKAFWNLSENITDTRLSFGVEETNSLLNLLSNFLDEETLDCQWNDDLVVYQRECWEVEFKPVALRLIDKIRSHHSYLEPLPDPI